MSKVVSITTLRRDATGSDISRRVASMPSRSGIRTSIRTTSGCSPPHLLERLAAVRGLADDLDVLLRLEDHPEPRTHERLVVRDQHANACPSPAARASTRAVPHPPGGPRRPRTACARASAAAGTTRWQAGNDELEELDRPVEVLEPLRAEVAASRRAAPPPGPRAARSVVWRDQDLAAVARRSRSERRGAPTSPR